MERSKLIHGKGVNDADYEVCRTEKINGKWKIVWTCPFYMTWKSMIARCYSDKFKIDNPTYADCKVCEEWVLFSNFKSWMEAQDWKNKQLDKDILFPGNKTYSPENCIFVSKALNSFLNKNLRSKGKYPTGVNWHKRVNKFAASCRNPFSGKVESLGYFQNPESAHNAYLKRKNEIAIVYADMQTDKRIAEALIKRFENGS